MKRILCLLMVAVMMCSLAGCGSAGMTPVQTIEPIPTVGFTAYTDAELQAQENKTFVDITMEDDSVIKLELYPGIAPITVENFVKLVTAGFYDGLTFHRIIDGFMIQGGDPEGTGMGGSGQNIKGEFADNGIKNNISHLRGVVSMARSNSPDSASSQFFIVHEDSTHLDRKYAAFGRVIEGIEVVDKIVENANVEDDNGTVAAENQPVIKSIKLAQ